MILYLRIKNKKPYERNFSVAHKRNITKCAAPTIGRNY
jgi:hypothetical protein